jgi:hypothetical protein
MTLSASKNLSMMKALEGHFLKATSDNPYSIEAAVKQIGFLLPQYFHFEKISNCRRNLAIGKSKHSLTY